VSRIRGRPISLGDPMLRSATTKRNDLKEELWAGGDLPSRPP
jgi:hypothetical protein